MAHLESYLERLTYFFFGHESRTFKIMLRFHHKTLLITLIFGPVIDILTFLCISNLDVDAAAEI